MAIFTAAAVATFLGIEAGFFATAAAFALNAAVTSLAYVGVSYAAQAVAGHQNQPAGATDSFGVQGKLAGGGEVTRSFNVGYSVTPGSLAYFNEHGGDTATPNAYLTQVIALADLPSGPLQEFWVNGEKMTLSSPLVGGAQGSDVGYAVPEYIKPRSDGGSPVAHLYIKYYDGTQTAADPYLVGTVSSDDRPYQDTRIFTGCAYAVVTALVNDKLWNGVPEFKFVLAVRLYDPSRDSSVGGDGDHRYDDPATWGGDGDGFPAVQAYNVLRGFSYNGVWLYGLQNTSAARLPVANWITQVEKCRASTDGADGPEPAYRTGMQINVNTQPVNAIQTLLTGCQGKISSIGGFFKLRLGAPDSPTFSFTDDDIVSIEPQSFRPFFALADSVNGIQARYPDPAQGWQYDTAPAYYRTDLEAKDGNRRLMASPSFDAVPYPAQVQRLQKSAIEEAQRARGHTVVLPPWYWTVEPGDVGAWTSPHNGYVTKQFRVDVAIDKFNLDIRFSLTEVDPADYDPPVLIPVTTGSTIASRPAPQGVSNWDAEPWILIDAGGYGRRPAIRLSWDGTLPGIVGVKYEVRLAQDASAVTDGSTLHFTDGFTIVSASLLPDEDYEARGQYLPSSPREMEWSDWIAVTTPEVGLGSLDLDPATVAQITSVFSETQERLAKAEDTLDLLGDEIARNHLDKTGLRGQTYAIRQDLISRIEVGLGEANAFIEEVQTVAVDTQTAFAAYTITTNATLGAIQSQVASTSLALSTLNGSFASFQTSVTAQFSATNASVSTEIAARSSADSALASSVTSLSATVAGNLATVNAGITSEAGARATADTAIAGTVTSLTATVGGNTAAISQEAVTRAGSDSALSATIVTLDSAVAGNTASISNEAVTRASADSALSGTVATLSTTVGGNTAAISAEATARSGADNAISVTLTSLNASVAGNAAGISNEAVTRANADNALSATIATLTSTVGGNTASIVSEALTRADADTAISGTITSLTSTVGGQTSSISTLTTAVAGVGVKFGVTGSINGVTGRFVFSGVARNDGGASFGLELDGNLVVNGSIGTNQIAVGGVDLVNIIDGATTKMEAASGTTGSGEICAVTIAVKGGRLVVLASYIPVGNQFNINGFIYVNNVLQKSGVSFSPDGGVTTTPTPIHLSLALTGLTDGNYVVSIRTSTGNAVDGTVVALNLRR